MQLTDEERARFADYLDFDATQTEALIEQMKKLPGGLESVIKARQVEVAAYRFVARHLRTIESVRIS